MKKSEFPNLIIGSAELALFEIYAKDDGSEGKRPVGWLSWKDGDNLFTYSEWLAKNKDEFTKLGKDISKFLLGWPITRGWFCVDTDIKGGEAGYESLKKLRERTGLKLAPDYETRSGGCHVWLYSDLSSKLITKVFKDYPGIEFLNAGKLAILHNPEFKHQNDCQLDGEALMVHLLELQQENHARIKRSAANYGTDAYPVELVRFWLSNLSERRFNNYHQWQSIIYGIHHHYEGSDKGYMLALEFSTRSTKFDRLFLDTMWSNADDDRTDNPCTIGTIRGFYDEDYGLGASAESEERMTEFIATRHLSPAQAAAKAADAEDSNQAVVTAWEMRQKATQAALGSQSELPALDEDGPLPAKAPMSFAEFMHLHSVLHAAGTRGLWARRMKSMGRSALKPWQRLEAAEKLLDFS